MWSLIFTAAKGFISKKALVWGLVLLIGGGSLWGVYRSINNAYAKASQYDLAIADRDAALAERDRANQQLLDVVAEHAADDVRKEQARMALVADRSAILKAAQIEGGKFRDLKERLKDVKIWSDGVVPAAIKRLYLGQAEPETSGTDTHNNQD